MHVPSLAEAYELYTAFFAAQSRASAPEGGAERALSPEEFEREWQLILRDSARLRRWLGLYGRGYAEAKREAERFLDGL